MPLHLPTLTVFLSLSLLTTVCRSQEASKLAEGNAVAHRLTDAELAAELQEAKELMQKFANTSSRDELSKMTRALIPTPEVCSKVFHPEVAEKLPQTYLDAWEKGDFIIAGKPGQTVVKLTAAATEDLIEWKGAAAQHLAGGWKRLRNHIHPGYRIYTIKFLEPEAEFGMSFDGLTKVDGKWYIFPKAWRMAPEM